MRRWACILWLALLAVGVATPPDRAVMLFVSGDGSVQDAAAQQTWQAPAQKALATVTAVAFQPAAALFLPAVPSARQAALLPFPTLLVASSQAPTLLAPRWLVLVRISDNKRAETAVLDVPHDERYALPAVDGNKPDQLMSHLADMLQKHFKRLIERSTVAVVGNTESHMYHLANADHTDRTKLVPFANERAARAAGYRPCPICFPTDDASDEGFDVGQLGPLMSQVMRLEYPVGPLPPSDDQALDEVAQKLAVANHLEPHPLAFKHVTTPDVFSVSFTGGETYLSDGLLAILETPDEKAAVLAHELAHVERQHFLQVFRQAYRDYGPPSVLRFETTASYGDFLVRLTRRLLRDGWPAPMEDEADGYAVQYMLRAGYNPAVYASTIHKIQEAEQAHHDKISAWTKVHPLSPARLAHLADWVAELQAVNGLAQSAGAFDPGLQAAMRAHAVSLAPALASARAFVAALQNGPSGAVRGEPALLP